MESVVAFWNARPCNIRHGTAELGTKEYFDQVEQRKYFVEPHIPRFAEFEKWKGQNVLEIGCGIGTDTLQFMKAGANITAIDISEESVRLARQRAQVFGFSTDQILVQNAETFSFPKNFDLIYSFGVIHHTPNPRAIIERAALHQVQGQELRIMLYSKFSYKLFWAMHTKNAWNFCQMNDTIREFAEAQNGCPIAYTYTFDEIQTLLEPYYVIEDIHKDHVFKWNTEKYVQHEYEIDEVFKDMTPENFRALEKELGWHTLVKAKRV